MRLIDTDALYETFERTPWFDNADRDIAEEVAENAPTVAEDNNVPVKQPDPITGRGQAGDNHWCSHCWDFAQTGVKYVVAVEDNRGMRYPTKRNIPYNYCPSCGRKLKG